MANGTAQDRVDEALRELLTSSSGHLQADQDHWIERNTESVAMRDATMLAADVYFAHMTASPVIVLRTCYGRRRHEDALTQLSRQVFTVVAQDCRGTGDSDPALWDYYVYESEDTVDTIDWITTQPWAGFRIFGIGASYPAAAQWCMPRHPAVTAIAPEVESLGAAAHTGIREYLPTAPYVETWGHGASREGADPAVIEREMLPDMLKRGFFNEPLGSGSLSDALCDSLRSGEGCR